MSEILIYGILIFFIGFCLLIFSSFYFVKNNHVVIVERLSKFNKISYSGLNFKIPFIDSCIEELSLSVCQFNMHIESKTRDNVFINIEVACQYKILAASADKYLYYLADPIKQMKSFVFDIIRSEIPKLNLDDVFVNKTDIANSVRQELKATFEEYGIILNNCLVIDINPDAKVKAAMNKINEEQRLRKAAFEKAQAEKTAIIISAEAEAEKKALHGKGVADERKAIVDGLKVSLHELNAESNSSDAIILLLANQYFDTLKEMAAKSNANTIFTNSSSDGFNNIMQQLRETIISAK